MDPSSCNSLAIDAYTINHRHLTLDTIFRDIVRIKFLILLSNRFGRISMKKKKEKFRDFRVAFKYTSRIGN